MTLKNFVIDAMIDELNEMEGREVYGADLGYEIFSVASRNGSYTCSTIEAENFICKYFSEIGEVVEDIKFSLGAEFIPNCFLQPEKFQVAIMLEMSSSLCGQCEFVNSNWNNEIELTEENIKLIISQLEELKD